MTEIAAPPLDLELPPAWQLVQVARPTLRPAPEDWQEHLARGLGQPEAGISLPKLLEARRGGRVVLVIEDITRHSPLDQILPIVLREIRHARFDDSQLELFIASGMHPPMTAQQVAEKVGPEAASLPWRCNPWADPKAYARIGSISGVDIEIDRGVATADLRIVISSVSPHLQAGFGGGYKMFLPGCASLATIRQLHRKGLSREAAQLVGTQTLRNGMRRVIDAGGALIDQHNGATFAVQYLLDENDMPAAIATGEPIPAQQMLAKQAAVACGVIVPAPGDVVVADAYPRDFDLWQSFKCIANTIWAARPGGVIICSSRCPGGVNGVKAIPWPMSPQWTKRVVSYLGPDNLANLVMRLAPRLAGDATFFVRMATQALHRNHLFIVSQHLSDSAVVFPGVQIFGQMSQAMDAARTILGAGPQRVVAFPSGGITYPVPARA